MSLMKSISVLFMVVAVMVNGHGRPCRYCRPGCDEEAGEQCVILSAAKRQCGCVGPWPFDSTEVTDAPEDEPDKPGYGGKGGITKYKGCNRPCKCPRGGRCVASGQSSTKCECVSRSAADFVSDGFIQENEGNNSNIIELSTATVYTFGDILAFILLLNLSIVCYNMCTSSKRRSRKYTKVSQIVSSDDDMQNLKEIEM